MDFMPPHTPEKIELRIDGRRVAAPPGSTILAAARAAGIRIPTLCFLDGFAPFTTCFVCVVQVRGRSGFVPACATPAAPGMEVITNSEEIVSTRRNALELLLSDHAGECEAPCTAACPAGLDIPRVTAWLEKGDAAAAGRFVAEHLPLAGILSRICPRPCERACRRGRTDAAVAIRDLVRHVADGACGSPAAGADTGKRVAVIGAGLSGLAAAWALRRAGHECTVFERAAQPGGLLRSVAPAFRAPDSELDSAVAGLRALGVGFAFDRVVNFPGDLEALRAEFHGVVIATGAGRPAPGPVASESGVLLPNAWDLAESMRRGRSPDVEGCRVLILGSGDIAVEVARALRRAGAAEVVLAWNAAGAGRPADPAGLEHAEAEGVRLRRDAGEVRVLARPGGGWTVGFAPAGDGSEESDFDRVWIAPARRRPEPPEWGNLDWRVRDRRRPWAVLMPGVFAAGECLAGPLSAAAAVAGGLEAVRALERGFRGEDPARVPYRYVHRAGDFTPEETAEWARFASAVPRWVPRPPADADAAPPAAARAATPGMPAEEVQPQAARCYQCGCVKADCCELRNLAGEYGVGRPRFRGERRRFARDWSHPEIEWSPGKCILCGRCIAIAEAAGERPGLALVRRGFGTEVRAPFDEELAAALSPATAARCVRECPTAALAWRPGRGPACPGAADEREKPS